MNTQEKDYGVGLIGAKSPGQLQTEQEEKDRASVELENGINENQESRLSSHIRTVWEANKQAKWRIHDRLINCMQLRKGVYDSNTKAAIAEMGGSDIFMMLTATKCRAAGAWIKDIILPTTEKAWSLKPTPIADMPEEHEEKLTAMAEESVAMKNRQMLEELQASGQEITPEIEAQMANAADDELLRLKREVTKEVQNEAKKASGKMETLIEDQMAEGGWAKALEEFTEDFVTFPSAIFKGHTLKSRKTLKWDGGTPVVTDEVIPTWERVSPFDIYPSADSSETIHGDLIEHLRFRRADIYAMIGVDGYDDAEIEGVLEEYGKAGLREWIFNEQERRDLEDKEIWYSSDTIIDGLHYWGSVQGSSLLEWGYSEEEIENPLAEYEIDAILIGRHVIRAVVNPDPMGRRPYHKASFQRVQGSWWGLAPPELMEDIQRTCNATARALINNMSMASGPMVGINVDRMASGDIPQVRPWAQFRFKSDPTGMGNTADAPLHFFQPNSNASELLSIYNSFESKADDATNIPRYMYGNEKIGGAGSTASGLAMLMDSASKGIKSAIRHIDRYVIRPAVEQIWFHNMLNNKDPEIMGDIKVIASGVNGIIARDQQQARRVELLERTANPIDMEIIEKDGRRDILDQLFKGMDMDGIVPTKEEYSEKQKNQASQPNEALELEKAKMELEFKKLELEELKINNEFELKKAALTVDAQSKQVGIPNVPDSKPEPENSDRPIEEQSGNGLAAGSDQPGAI